jgi:hypothetical protein
VHVSARLGGADAHRLQAPDRSEDQQIQLTARGTGFASRTGQLAASEQSVDCSRDGGRWRGSLRQRQRVGSHASPAESHGVITAGLAVVGAAQGAAEGVGEVGGNDLESIDL